jgi:NADPH:quinone reductase-like Zn-dependent oxidoreductase
MGQNIIALAKLAGVKTLNVDRREEAAEQVRQFGGDRVVFEGDNLHKDVEAALGGKKLRLILDMVGGTPVGELAKSLKSGGSIVSYAILGGQMPVISPKDFIYRGLSLHGFWLDTQRAAHGDPGGLREAGRPRRGWIALGHSRACVPA